MNTISTPDTLISYCEERGQYRLNWELISVFAGDANQWIAEYRQHAACNGIGKVDGEYDRQAEWPDADYVPGTSGGANVIAFPGQALTADPGEYTAHEAMRTMRAHLQSQVQRIDEFLELRASGV